MTQKITFLQGAKKLFLMVACFTLAVVLLGGVKAAAASKDVTTEQGTFTIGYGGYGSNKYDAPTVIGYKGSESDVTLPTKVTINDEEQDITILGDAFKGNTAITSVTIPEGYTSIGISALSGCSGLTSITIPSSLQTVGATAFQNCTKLTTVNFTENESGTLKFMNKVFDSCTALASINLPVQTTSVYDNGNIFTGCTALESITVSPGNTKYFSLNGSLYAKNDDDSAVTLCTYVKAPAELTLPKTVNGLPLTAVGPMVFQGSTALTAVTLPANITTIDRLAFDTCSNLKTVLLQCEAAPTLGALPSRIWPKAAPSMSPMIRWPPRSPPPANIRSIIPLTRPPLRLALPALPLLMPLPRSPSLWGPSSRTRSPSTSTWTASPRSASQP